MSEGRGGRGLAFVVHSLCDLDLVQGREHFGPDRCINIIRVRAAGQPPWQEGAWGDRRCD